MNSWHFWCRLCAKNDEQKKIRIYERYDEIEDKGQFVNVEKLEYGKHSRIKDAMLRFFNINFSEHWEVPTYLCRECYSLLASLLQFTEVVNKAQNMFDYLHNEGQNITDLKSVREKFLDKMNHSFKNLLDGFEFELNCQTQQELKLEIKEEDLAEVNPLDIIETKLTTPANTNILKHKSEVSLYDDNVQVSKRPKKDTYKCAKCQQEFKTARERRTHFKNEHPPSESTPKKERNIQKIYPCPHCEECFSSYAKKDLHIRAKHSDKKSYVCDKCGLGMNSDRSLRQHMLTHREDTPYNCPTCNRNFKVKTGLKRHMETHDPKKYICPTCGIHLNSRSTFNRHLLVHSNKMAHKCEYCGRAFKRSNTLKHHLIIHTGLRPYECDFCGRTFTQGANCRKHKREKHPKELAEQDAAGIRTFTKNLPTISALKAFTSKEAKNIALDKKKSLQPKWGRKQELDNVLEES